MAMLTPPSVWIRPAMASTSLSLFVEVLVEEQVKLIKGRPADLPVVLLVQIPQGHGIDQQLVEILYADAANRRVERDGNGASRAGEDGFDLPHGAWRGSKRMSGGGRTPAGAVEHSPLAELQTGNGGA